MKKKLFFILLLIILPVIVNAKTVKVGSNTYSIEEIANLCDKAGMVIESFDEKGAICLDPADNFTKMYRVNETGVKKELTNQEYLDVYNRFDYTYYDYIMGEDDIKKNTGAGFNIYVEVPISELDTNKSYTIIEIDGNGNGTYTTVDPGFTIDPTLKYYKEIYTELPKSSDVKTDSSIIYYKYSDTLDIYEEVTNPKSEEILNYRVESDNLPKTENVAKIDSELVAKLTSQNYFVRKHPNKDIYYIFQEEASGNKVYKHTGELLFENIDSFGVINEDIIYTIENGKVVFYNESKEVLETISGDCMFILRNSESEVVFSTDNQLAKTYAIRKVKDSIEEKIEDKKEEQEQTQNKPIVDIKNPDTGDTIILALVLCGISLIGILVVSKHKRKEI